MENCFLNCCYDSLLIGTRSECDRFSYQEGKHDPVFNLYYHKVNNEYFHCVSRKLQDDTGNMLLNIVILFTRADAINAVFAMK